MTTMEIAMLVFLVVIVFGGAAILWRLRIEEREEVEELKRHLKGK